MTKHQHSDHEDQLPYCQKLSREEKVAELFRGKMELKVAGIKCREMIILKVARIKCCELAKMSREQKVANF